MSLDSANGAISCTAFFAAVLKSPGRIWLDLYVLRGAQCRSLMGKKDCCRTDDWRTQPVDIEETRCVEGCVGFFVLIACTWADALID